MAIQAPAGTYLRAERTMVSLMFLHVHSNAHCVCVCVCAVYSPPVFFCVCVRNSLVEKSISTNSVLMC